ncbi:MAG: hypothetical protein ACYC5R_06555 [Melioribacteraceae bacterium]
MNELSTTLSDEEIQKTTEFFKAIFYSQEGMIESRSFSVTAKNLIKFISLGEYEKIFELINNNPTYNHFFGVASRKNDSNGRKENCNQLGALYVDIDYGQTGHKKRSYFLGNEEALAHIKRCPIRPSIIVDSGHGFHLYWLLSAPITVTKESIPVIEDLMKDLSLMLGGDSTQDVSRILRIPYTLNLKEAIPVKSYILFADYKIRYTLEHFELFFKEDHKTPLIKILRSKNKIRNAIFGLFDEPINDRSVFDQKILTMLTGEGITEEVITNIFDLFPTTGKYLESKEKNPQAAEQYLLHSINKSQTYLMDQNMNSNKETGSITKINRMMENLSMGSSTSSPQTGISILPAGLFSNNSNAALKLFPINNVEDSPSLKTKRASRSRSLPTFSQKEESNCVGYYYREKEAEDEIPMSNFLLQFTRQISATIDHSPTTKLEGVVKLSGGKEIKFTDFEASMLGNIQKTKEFLHNLCGVEVAFFGNDRFLCEAIKYFNQETKKERALEFGYNAELTEYVTPDFIISRGGISSQSTPILHSEQWHNNTLGFTNVCPLTIDELIARIIEEYFRWDDPQVTFFGFAFAMLPIVFPFFREYVHGKPYLTFLGPSGCGKTTIARILQQFFGEFRTLFSWTSTPTAVQVAGNAFKDALFVVDDFKRQNFAYENMINKVMAMIQNYSDEHSRSRSNVNLKLRDEKMIKGGMILSAEDLVISESSTIARGIVIEMNKKDTKMLEAQDMTELSKYFSFFTLKYIEHFLGSIESRDMKALYNKNLDLIQGRVAFNNLVGDNVPRMINNFALVKSSWDLASEFLFAGRDSSKYNEKFDVALEEALISNFNRIQDHKPEEKFEETLWSMIEQGNLFSLNTRHSTNTPHFKIVVLTSQKENEKPTIGIKFTHAFKEVNEYLREEGGIGVSQKTLITKLIQLGKISTPPCGRVTVGEELPFRGFYWTGEIPYDTLSLRRPEPTDSDLPF